MAQWQKQAQIDKEIICVWWKVTELQLYAYFMLAFADVFYMYSIFAPVSCTINWQYPINKTFLLTQPKFWGMSAVAYWVLLCLNVNLHQKNHWHCELYIGAIFLLKLLYQRTCLFPLSRCQSSFSVWRCLKIKTKEELCTHTLLHFQFVKLSDELTQVQCM